MISPRTIDPSTQISGVFTKVLLDTTQKSITSTTDIYTLSIPGGTLGTNNAIKVTIINPYYNGTTNGSATCNFKYGGTSFGSLTIGTNSSQPGDRDLQITGMLYGIGTTSTQRGYITTIIHPIQSSSTQTDVDNASGSPSIDSTIAQNFVCTITITGGSTFTCDGCLLEVVR
jgi:hypothetical protein